MALCFIHPFSREPVCAYSRRFEESKMGIPMLGSQYFCELLLLGYIKLQMAQRKKWDPERVKAAIEAIKNKEMGSYKTSRVFNVP